MPACTPKPPLPRSRGPNPFILPLIPFRDTVCPFNLHFLPFHRLDSSSSPSSSSAAAQSVQLAFLPPPNSTRRLWVRADFPLTFGRLLLYSIYCSVPKLLTRSTAQGLLLLTGTPALVEHLHSSALPFAYHHPHIHPLCPLLALATCRRRPASWPFASKKKPADCGQTNPCFRLRINLDLICRIPSPNSGDRLTFDANHCSFIDPSAASFPS